MKRIVLISALIITQFFAYTSVSGFVSSPGNPIQLGQNYPNPAKNKTIINIDFSFGEGVFKVYNILGKQVEEIRVSPDKKFISLDVSEYQEGIYLYTFEAESQKLTRRLTVKK